MAQFPLGVRYNNGGSSFNGDYTIIGNVMWWTNGVQGYGKNNGNYGNQSGFLNLDTSSASNKPIFASSMQVLNIPQVSSSCFKVKWAGLYWAGTIARKDINNAALKTAKLRLPGSNAYVTLTADVPRVLDDTRRGNDLVYNCYKDVTNLLKGLSNVNGDYWVGDVFFYKSILWNRI
ncbi:MAG: hypothetical protein ACTTJI_09815 [Capnocytophaga sp.]|uniref:hypothetical protein n=1 Tax=Capnocytophaga sp. TaxID=44737 RepID=UPI003FA00BA2